MLIKKVLSLFLDESWFIKQITLIENEMEEILDADAIAKLFKEVFFNIVPKLAGFTMQYIFSIRSEKCWCFFRKSDRHARTIAILKDFLLRTVTVREFRFFKSCWKIRYPT